MIRLLIIAMMALVTFGHAAYFGNPTAPEKPECGPWIPCDLWYGAKAGYQCDSVFDRRMEVSKGKGCKHQPLEEYTLFNNLGVATFNCMNRFEAYLGLGLMHSKICQRPQEDVKIELKTGYDFSLEGGARAILIQWKEWVFGIDGKYLYSHLEIDRIVLNGKEQKGGGTVGYREWQAGFALGNTFAFLSPYAGVAFSGAVAKIKGIPKDPTFPFHLPREKLRNRDLTTLILGLGIGPWATFSANIEARVFGEIALSGTLDFRF